MKIENKNKRDAYSRFIARAGVGFAKKYYTRPMPQSCYDQMHHKPYGGIYEQKHTSAGTEDSGSAEA